MSNILEESVKIKRIWGAFRQARVLLTANNYRIFDCLEKRQSAKTVAKKLKTDLRATAILLDALAGLGFITKKNNAYKNTGLASRYLVASSPHYQGNIIRHAENLWQNWSELDTVLKTGKPYHKSHDHESFIMGMHDLASLKAGNVLKAIGVTKVRTALDLGGGPGTYSIEMAGKGVQVTLFDRPETVEIAKRVIKNPKFKIQNSKLGSIKFIQGDFVHDDFGKGYDLIFASQILHSMSEKECITLLKKCKKALNIGGRIVIQEFHISKDLTQPAHSALFSVNMLVNTEGGRCYSPEEMKEWLSKMGMKEIKVKPVDDSVLVSAKK